jgi:hypothetical protein
MYAGKNRIGEVNLTGGGFILFWACLIFIVILISIFFHEVGHGIGFRMTGTHVSTGFNRVGNPYKFPDDPDFRTGMQSSVFGTVLGPGINLLFASIFTLWLYRSKKSHLISLAIGAVAISNSLIRLVPMLMFFGAALFGWMHIEDEVGLGVNLAVWANTRADSLDYGEKDQKDLDREHILSNGLRQFGSTPLFWLPVILSTFVSLICLIMAYSRLHFLYKEKFPSRQILWAFWLTPAFIFPIILVVSNFLDQVWRINW